MLGSPFRWPLLPILLATLLPQLTSADQHPQPPPLATAMHNGSAAMVDTARLRNLDIEPGEWMTTGRDGTYSSPLKAINDKSVKDLGFAWEYSTGTRRGLEATPLVVDGTMYATGNWGVVYALDAATGKLRWTFDPHSDPQVARYEQNDVVNRGLVVWKGAVYVVSADCRLIAITAEDGTKRWEVNTLVNRDEPYVCTGAPQLADQLIVVGNAGADSSKGGLRGYVSAFDSQTGKLRWRTYTVPSLKERNPTPELQRAAATWDPKRDPSFGGGGTVWNSMAYDADLRLLYLGTGNAAPYNASHVAQGHADDKLYTASIVALRADTGRMAWYFQTTPGDRWDYDAAATIILADLDINGRKRLALLQANKNGYFYVLDRINGRPISAKPYVYANWTSGLDADFRPIASSEGDYNLSPKLVYPGLQGAHSWQPMSYSAQTGFVYIPSTDGPNLLVDLTRNPGATVRFVDEATDGLGFVFPDRDYDPAAWTPILGSLPKVPARNPHTNKALVRSSLMAWDPVKQQLAWEQETSSGYFLLDGGTLATAGNVVFAGREDGQFVAYAADTGKILKTIATGTPIMAAPMTYEVAGTQYVAVMAGHGGEYLNSFAGTAAMKYVNEGRIIVFKLGGLPEVRKPALRVATGYSTPPKQSGTPEQIANGARLFNTWCARCHGLGVPAVTPDLSRLNDGIASLDVFRAIVLQGAFAPQGMPRFSDVLTADGAESLHDYLIDLASKGYTSQGAAPTATPPH